MIALHAAGQKLDLIPSNYHTIEMFLSILFQNIWSDSAVTRSMSWGSMPLIFFLRISLKLLPKKKIVCFLSP